MRAWHLTGHGYGNLYYAAAVRSMAESWHNSLFAAFDPGGLLMLDKPPLAFWIQVLSVKLVGYSGLAIHLPQLLEGLSSVALVYYLTRKVAGPWAGVLAGAVMALTLAFGMFGFGRLAGRSLHVDSQDRRDGGQAGGDGGGGARAAANDGRP